jgi:Holliday junction resolvase
VTNPSKRKGSTFEVGLRDRVNELGFKCHRLTVSGTADMGDLAIDSIDNKDVYVVEAKATKAIDLAGFIAEANVEAVNYAKKMYLNPDLVHPVVMVKRRMASLDKTYVVMELGEWLKVIR